MNDRQLEKIVSAYGTPLYVLDEAVLRDRVAYLRQRLPSEIQLCYAVKANTFIVDALRDLVDCYEVCSPGELRICQEQKLPPEQMVISGVYKTPAVMEELIASGAPIRRITVESMQQFVLMQELAQKYSRDIRLLLRLSSGNQFGLNEEELRKLLCHTKEYPALTICGIQYYSGTQKTSLKRLKRELEYLDRLLGELQKESGYEIRELEFGPGFPVSYFQSEEFDEDAYLAGFCGLLNSMQHRAAITLELGRSIAAGCGSYLTRVVDKKTNQGQNYAIVDGGIHQLSYYGQSMAMKHPLYEVYPKRSPAEQGGEECGLWNLCGSLCTVNDILVKQLPLGDLQTGDMIIFKNTGAYCMTEGIALFLSRELPGIILNRRDGMPVLLRDEIQTAELNAPRSGTDNTGAGHTL